ncbi:hypothetical protein [Massilia sp. CCM 8734]|uniref:hypothetical protein n=1 Tax=Massilia sp. CCM 8734 TaxID=2609283 RepID=UPI00141ECB16|nr:hypothetical protein [Massilia sp. CCM 8734]NHZ94616.1 hypothetical protein [Massilia sp. CCM 8734]
MSTINEMGNIALDNLIRAVEKVTAPDGWECAYHRGEINVIADYMDPDPALLEKARRAIDEMIKRQVRNGQ